MVSGGGITRCLKRLEKEKEDLSTHGELFTLEVDSNKPHKWIIGFEGAVSSLYEGEKFKLQFLFGESYVNF